MTSRKAPDFYCNHCHRKVASRHSVCPYCGAVFRGVLCPRCQYSGAAGEFGKGCPVCGYMQAGHPPPSEDPPGKERKESRGLSRSFLKKLVLSLACLVGALLFLLLRKLLLPP